MKTQDKIFNIFNKNKKPVEWDNELKISKTVQPETKASFNEVFTNVHEQLNKKVKNG